MDDIVGIAASKHTVDNSTKTDATPHESPDAARAPSTPDITRPCEPIPASSAETPPNEDKPEVEKSGNQTLGRQLAKALASVINMVILAAIASAMWKALGSS